MARLTLQMLGPPIVAWDGRPVQFATRRALALFAYLALTPGMQSRDQLAALLWEREQTTSRTALRNTLVYLRQAFGDTPPILASRDAIGIDPAIAIESDLAQLRDATMEHPERWRLYRGELLAGLVCGDAPAFEEWLTIQRAQWQRRWIAILDLTTRHALDTGAVDQAREAAEVWLAHDPLNETAAVRLMRAYLAAGERGAAQHVATSLRTHLANELGSAPSAEVLALEQQAHAPDLAPAPAAHAAGALYTAFVGRSEPVARLTGAYHAAASGQPQAAVIKGESGIGKSRLLAEFCGWAGAHSADILIGQAFEVSEGFAYQPIVMALRHRLERERAPDDLLDDVWLSELARLLPELRERYPDLAPPHGQDLAAQSRLFEAVARLLLAWAHRAPLVLAIDDLQWADAASCDLLQYVARRAAETPARVMLVVALRSEATERTAALRPWLQQLARSLPLTDLQLDLLSATAVRQIVTDLADRPDGLAPLADWLHTETGGQPFYLVETLASLYEQGVLIDSPANPRRLDVSTAAYFVQTHRRIPVPSGIYAVIATRLARLEPGPYALMAVSAVLGRGASFDTICELAGVEPLQALSDHDLLVGQRIWTLDPAQQISFRHDQIRTVAYAELGETRRRILHRQVVERLREPLPPAERAYHARRAGMATDALRHAIAAGDAALALFAVRDAVTQYAEAHRDLSGGADATAQEWIRLYDRLGRAYELLHQFDQAATVYHELLDRASSVGIHEAAALALQRLALLAMWRFDLTSAQTLLAQAIDRAERADHPLLLAECYWARAQLAVYSWESLQALTDGARAHTLAQTLSDHGLVARACLTLAHATANLGRWEQTATYASEAYTTLVGLGDLALQAESMALQAAAQIGMGASEAGARLAAEALALGRRIENPWAIMFAGHQLIAAQIDTADLMSAAALAAECAALAADLPIPPVQLLALVSEIQVVAVLGDDEKLSALLDRLDTLVESVIPTRFGRELVSVLRCVAAARGDRWIEAGAYAQTAVGLIEPAAIGPALPRWWLITALARSGATERAAREVARITALADSNPRHQLLLLRCRAALAAEIAPAEHAVHVLVEAEQIAARFGLLLDQISIAHALTAAHRALGADDALTAAEARAAALSIQIASRIADPALREAATRGLQRWR
jgi:DNA-binding SARP family transcriptional activator